MTAGRIPVPPPRNEPVRDYVPDSAEARSLGAEIRRQRDAGPIEIPIRIGDATLTSRRTGEARSPHDHGHLLGTVHKADESHVKQAVEAAARAWKDWSETPWQDRVGVFLRAADLLSGPWRDRINAATILGQSKTVYQAEIDAACELIDFWRYNCHYLSRIQADQPLSSPGVWNFLDYRPLEGFVFAVSPFNFTAIAGNLPTAPALMGNTVIWKPAPNAMYSNSLVMDLLTEAGLPPGVINMLPGDGPDVGDPALAHPDLAGIHFTGSTATFQHLWKAVGQNIGNYRSYPRLVGETGGKDFIFAHPSAEVPALVTALVRGAFEFQGQKCSAASRAFIPASLWDAVSESLLQQVASIRVGNPEDFSHFMGAVIDRRAFDKISGYIEHARTSNDHEIIAGGGCDDSTGYFIEPTVVVASKADSKLMREEIFGPVLTLYRYADDAVDEALDDCDRASPYALTGAIFARDRYAIAKMSRRLRHAAGNFYVNDKPTGAVVGQQPFGGGRASGTNDKAGSMINLLRWVSPRNIKETFVPPTDYRYPYMG